MACSNACSRLVAACLVCLWRPRPCTNHGSAVGCTCCADPVEVSSSPARMLGETNMRRDIGGGAPAERGESCCVTGSIFLERCSLDLCEVQVASSK
eukprot:2987640-Amphidinium_carterae.1